MAFTPPRLTLPGARHGCLGQFNTEEEALKRLNLWKEAYHKTYPNNIALCVIERYDGARHVPIPLSEADFRAQAQLRQEGARDATSVHGSSSESDDSDNSDDAKSCGCCGKC